MHLRSAPSLVGWLRVRIFSPRGSLVQEVAGRNKPTFYAMDALCSWLTGVANTSAQAGAVLFPRYMALGNGSGTPSNGDLGLFSEVYGTRKLVASQVVQPPSGIGIVGNAALLTLTLQASDPSGTFTEAGVFDQPTAALSLAQSASAGSTAITVTSNNIPWFAGEHLYIADPTNPEYASVSGTPAQGATQIPLAAALQYSHASGTPVYVFVGNLWNHAMFSTSVSKPAGYLAQVQWYIGFGG